MPPLSSLSLNHAPPPQQQSPPAVHAYASLGGRTGTQTPNSYFTAAMAASQPPLIHSHSPAEAHIQSWADATVPGPPQQPRPMPPMPQGMWTPDMGIKFAGVGGPVTGAGESGGAGAGGNPKPQGGTWEPGSGIRFG